MRLTLILATLAIGLLAAIIGAIYLSDKSAAQGLLRPDDHALITQGQHVYVEQCAACHGAKLEGQPNWRDPNADGRLPAPPHDESGHTWHHPDAVLFGITKFGLAKVANMPDHQSDMPAYEDVLSDQEIIAVLSYIKSTWSDEVRKMHDQRNAMAKARQ